MNLFEALKLMGKVEFMMNGMEYIVPSANILGLPEESDCSAYDCEFVSLAQQLNLMPVTSDRIILEKFPETDMHMSEFEKS